MVSTPDKYKRFEVQALWKLWINSPKGLKTKKQTTNNKQTEHSSLEICEVLGLHKEHLFQLE